MIARCIDADDLFNNIFLSFFDIQSKLLHNPLLPMQDDIASVAYWYQSLPTAPFPELPDSDYLEVI